MTRERSKFGRPSSPRQPTLPFLRGIRICACFLWSSPPLSWPAAARPRPRLLPHPRGEFRDQPDLAVGREGTRGRRHQAMVVSGSPIASEVGRDILRAGGNAVDAAVAVGFALAVVHPEAGNLGGGGFMVFRMADGTTAALDYREAAPGARPTTCISIGPAIRRPSRTGARLRVPGSVAGLVEAHNKFGKLPFATVIEPAIKLASEGFVVDDHRSRSIDNYRAWLFTFAASRATSCPTAVVPRPGFDPGAGRSGQTLTAIRDHGADGFYKGWVADSIVAEMDRGGGLISLADLGAYRAIWRDPIKIEYRGYTIYSMPPASSGGVTLALILNIMEGYGTLPPSARGALASRSGSDAPGLHRPQHLPRRSRLRENAARSALVKEYAATLRQQIDPHHATPTPPFDPSLRDGTSTTHYSVVDSLGNAVSCTTTLNDSYGSAERFRAPGSCSTTRWMTSRWHPGSRTATASFRGGELDRAGQTDAVGHDAECGPDSAETVHGGRNSRRSHDHHPGVPRDFQRHRSPHGAGDAVAAPRMHHQALPDPIRLEQGGFQPAAIAELERLGHGIQYRGGWAMSRRSFGCRADEGVSDPRGGGGGSGYSAAVSRQPSAIP